MATSMGSHAGSGMPGMESTPVQRTTDSSSVGAHYADLGNSTAKWRCMDEMLDELCSKETIESFGLKTQNWTEKNSIELREGLILAIKENYEEWNEDPELAFEECRDYVQDILLEDQLDRLHNDYWSGEIDTREQDMFIDEMLKYAADEAHRQREWFIAMSEMTAQVDREMRAGPPQTPRLTTVEPTLPPPPPIKLRHTRNTDGRVGMFVDSERCGCLTCCEVREEQCECPACFELREDPLELEDLVNQYRW